MGRDKWFKWLVIRGQVGLSCFPHQHDDVIKWKHSPRYWPFVRGIHRSPVNSPHKGQWRGALMYSLICAWMNGWVNNREAGDLRRHRAHYDVTVMKLGPNTRTVGYGKAVYELGQMNCTQTEMKKLTNLTFLCYDWNLQICRQAISRNGINNVENTCLSSMRNDFSCLCRKQVSLLRKKLFMYLWKITEKNYHCVYTSF